MPSYGYGYGLILSECAFGIMMMCVVIKRMESRIAIYKFHILFYFLQSAGIHGFVLPISIPLIRSTIEDLMSHIGDTTIQFSIL